MPAEVTRTRSDDRVLTGRTVRSLSVRTPVRAVRRAVAQVPRPSWRPRCRVRHAARPLGDRPPARRRSRRDRARRPRVPSGRPARPIPRSTDARWASPPIALCLDMTAAIRACPRPGRGRHVSPTDIGQAHGGQCSSGSVAAELRRSRRRSWRSAASTRCCSTRRCTTGRWPWSMRAERFLLPGTGSAAARPRGRRCCGWSTRS